MASREGDHPIVFHRDPDAVMGAKGYTDFYYLPMGHIRVYSFPEFDNASNMAKKDNGYANEDIFQAAAFQWTWNTFPELRRLFFHPKNEGNKNIVTAIQDRGKGVVPGVADFIFFEPRFAVELKQPGKTQNEDQLKFEAKCKERNIPYYLVEYMEDYQRIVTAEIDKIKWW